MLTGIRFIFVEVDYSITSNDDRQARQHGGDVVTVERDQRDCSALIDAAMRDHVQTLDQRCLNAAHRLVALPSTALTTKALVVAQSSLPQTGHLCTVMSGC